MPREKPLTGCDVLLLGRDYPPGPAVANLHEPASAMHVQRGAIPRSRLRPSPSTGSMRPEVARTSVPIQRCAKCPSDVSWVHRDASLCTPPRRLEAPSDSAAVASGRPTPTVYRLLDGWRQRSRPALRAQLINCRTVGLRRLRWLPTLSDTVCPQSASSPSLDAPAARPKEAMASMHGDRRQDASPVQRRPKA